MSRFETFRGPRRHSRGGRRAAGPNKTRLVLELLEGRELPSTFTVANLNDAGPGSLRQAILDANAMTGHDVIDFAPQLRGTIALTRGQLSITDGVTLDGPGDERIAVSGNDASRVFQIASGV